MKLNEYQIDFFKETMNIGVGKSARMLNTMLNSHITLNVPEVFFIDDLNQKQIFTNLDSSVSAVNLKFDGILQGDCQLLFPSESATQLVNSVIGEMENDGQSDLDAMGEGVLKEIGNIVLNSIMGVMGNTLNINLIYSVPSFSKSPLKELINKHFSEDSSVGLVARIQFKIEVIDVKGEVLTIFKMGSFDHVLNHMDKLLND